MSQFGWRGPKVKRTYEENYDPERSAQLKRIQAELAAEQQNKRFRDGPVFQRRLNVPKVHFTKKAEPYIVGFLGAGCVTFFFLQPIWYMFIKPMFFVWSTPTPDKLTTLDPQEVLHAELSKSYNRDNPFSKTHLPGFGR